MLQFLTHAGMAALLVFAPTIAPRVAPADPPAARYQDTAVGPELCSSANAAGTSVALFVAAICQVERVQYVLSQGGVMRAKAITQGATCEQYRVTGQSLLSTGPGIWVCFGYRSPLIQRGGTTYGDTFFYAGSQNNFAGSSSKQAVINHEAEHTVQWYLFGSRYPQLYFEAGPNACTNIFEITAGLAAGGYSC